MLRMFPFHNLKDMLLGYINTRGFPGETRTLEKWREDSYFIVLITLCIVALPALVSSTILAVRENLWINVFAYITAYALCLAITFFRSSPFKARAWAGVFIFFALGLISIQFTGLIGSGRIWFFATTIFTTLILGIRAGALILFCQAIALTVYYFSLSNDPALWMGANQDSVRIWLTTSITLIFLSVISAVSMERLIKGISMSLKKAQEIGEQNRKTAQELAQRVKDHNETITSLKESEARLQKAQKMEAIGTLAGGIAHDFNNILFPIMGYVEMLLDETPEEDIGVREYLHQIYISAFRAKELVHQILAFSRQEQKEYKPLMVQSIIKEAGKLLRATIPQSIEIKQDIDNTCPVILADETQIHQIIMNLATNAFHAIGNSKGNITLSLHKHDTTPMDSTAPELKPGKYVCLSVSDTGAGIPPETMKNIFHPFFTTKEKGKGTGMGLSVVHGIVQSMNGLITVESTPGSGSEFTLYFPIDEHLVHQPEHTDAPENEAAIGKERILLVDDDPAILRMEKQALEKLGYIVMALSNPVEAIQVFSHDPKDVDLVITDLSMPKMSGKELSSELLTIRPNLPVIICTGFNETLSLVEANAMGIKDIVQKPMLMKELSKKIRVILDQTTAV